ncbi:hypothetical protein V5N11_021301 [Cardamine amara subsp. amara]|uniref:Uncharacterized protein n=1 Tax=Cardamine amara subsp. amara TaxID=228776 RepID=A0ABD1B194_CARAN
MASDSATVTIITEEPMEMKVNDEIMEKETETVDVVKDKPESDSIQIVVKEEQVDETLRDDDNKVTAESKKESPVVVVEEVADAEESAEKVKDKSDEKKEAKQVKEVNVEAVDDKKDSLEEESVETADVKIVDVSESRNEARMKHEDEVKDVEAVSAADVEIDTTEVKVLEVESKPEKESVSEVEVKAEENSETKEETEVELQVKVEEKTVETKSPEEVVLISQDLVSEPKKETEEVTNSSSVDFIEKISTEADHVMEEPSKDEEENERKDKDVGNKTLKEDESIKEVAEKVVEELETEHEVKESGETKQEEQVGAKEVGVKPKHSNNILSKVKQSLVKAKKAIIGKSPSSKTTSTEAKEEIKVK